MLVDCRQTDTQRAGDILVRLILVEVHLNDTTGLRRELLINVAIHHFDDFIVVLFSGDCLWCQESDGLLLCLAVCNDVEAAISDTGQQIRSLRLLFQWDGTSPQLGEDILYHILRLVFVAQRPAGCRQPYTSCQTPKGRVL